MTEGGFAGMTEGAFAGGTEGGAGWQEGGSGCRAASHAASSE